jgi:hypothetical protein
LNHTSSVRPLNTWSRYAALLRNRTDQIVEESEEMRRAVCQSPNRTALITTQLRNVNPPSIEHRRNGSCDSGTKSSAWACFPALSRPTKGSSSFNENAAIPSGNQQGMKSHLPTPKPCSSNICVHFPLPPLQLMSAAKQQQRALTRRCLKDCPPHCTPQGLTSFKAINCGKK